jgi:hypothetical protein
MKNIIRNTTLVIIFCYLGTSFAFWDLNPALWGTHARVVLFSIICVIVYALVAYENI